jgi:ribosomal protein S18 acetylase RimI-like enzyme
VWGEKYKNVSVCFYVVYEMIRVVGDPDPVLVRKTLKRAIGFSNSERFIFVRHSAVVFIDNEPVGAVVFSMDDEGVYINTLGVIKEYRGRGAGRALVEYVERVAREKGAKYIEVIPVNNSEGFYRKLGFKDSGEKFVLIFTKTGEDKNE